ncbi:MAG: hypothetical protein AUH29_01295 [Candidatus Rokubacteria bacterium 13_1_40CM_69_27]|nr:MAG: hypothetical protein AUH29_01295 [Candidatus Rokubacteria bacterium 13_1_40CM_69_27]
MTWAALAVLALGVVAAARPADALEPLPAVLHVHSDITTGDFPLEDLARTAEQQGIEALLLAENYLVRIEYGVPPFRALTRVTRQERSVLDFGLERYLARVAEVRRQYPRVLLLPGVEVIPHYYWTGSPLALTLHNTQKNLLVFGVTDAQALASLPVTSNRHESIYTWQSALEAAPGLLVIPGIVLLLTKRRRRRRIGRTIVIIRQRSWFSGVLVLGLGVLTVVRAWPFTVDRYPPWEDYGLAPHQALIDRVESLGGATVWSFPEATDAGEQWVGPVRVSWETEPYADDLLKTFRYTALGGLYEQATRVVDPGGAWDRLLAQYAAGERRRPAWAIGESGFHGLTAGKRLGTMQTVFLTTEKSEAAVLDALKRGRLYALSRTLEVGLVLGDFSIAGGEATVISGETLRLPAGTPIEVRVAVDATDAGSLPVRVTLLRNGEVAEAWTGRTPFRAVYRDAVERRSVVFRLDARAAASHRLLTSPIFVTGS